MQTNDGLRDKRTRKCKPVADCFLHQISLGVIVISWATITMREAGILILFYVNKVFSVLSQVSGIGLGFIVK